MDLTLGFHFTTIAESFRYSLAVVLVMDHLAAWLERTRLRRTRGLVIAERQDRKHAQPSGTASFWRFSPRRNCQPSRCRGPAPMPPSPYSAPPARNPRPPIVRCRCPSARRSRRGIGNEPAGRAQRAEFAQRVGFANHDELPWLQVTGAHRMTPRVDDLRELLGSTGLWSKVRCTRRLLIASKASMRGLQLR